jgi:hypothetical protein
MAKMKTYIEQNPFEKFPKDVKVDEKPERDEDERLDDEWDKKWADAERADAYFAPSEGYN